MFIICNVFLLQWQMEKWSAVIYLVKLIFISIWPNMICFTTFIVVIIIILFIFNLLLPLLLLLVVLVLLLLLLLLFFTQVSNEAMFQLFLIVIVVTISTTMCLLRVLIFFYFFFGFTSSPCYGWFILNHVLVIVIFSFIVSVIRLYGLLDTIFFFLSLRITFILLLSLLLTLLLLQQFTMYITVFVMARMTLCVRHTVYCVQGTLRVTRVLRSHTMTTIITTGRCSSINSISSSRWSCTIIIINITRIIVVCRRVSSCLYIAQFTLLVIYTFTFRYFHTRWFTHFAFVVFIRDVVHIRQSERSCT